MKIIFIDIDGTLITNFGSVPESAVKAIKLAREKGHLVYINTGRSRAQVFDYIQEIGFDGYICSEGMYVESNGKILKKESLNKEQIDKINEYIKKTSIGFMIEGHSVFQVNSAFLENKSKFMGKDDFERFKLVFPFSKVVEEVPYEEIGKINFPVMKDYSAELQKEMGDDIHVGFFTVEGEEQGMMYFGKPGIDKMNGVDFLLEELDLKDAETYAFGDTGGDIGMVKGCTVGIAMGNGETCLKKVADYVTDAVEDDGLYNAFVKYGII